MVNVIIQYSPSRNNTQKKSHCIQLNVFNVKLNPPTESVSELACKNAWRIWITSAFSRSSNSAPALIKARKTSKCSSFSAQFSAKFLLVSEFHGWTFLFGPTQRTLASVTFL